MKHIKFFVVLFCALFVTLGACSDNDKGEFYETNFVLEKNVLSFMQQADENTFQIKSSYLPEVSTNQTWVDVKLTALTATIYQLVVSVENNSTGDDRTATITVKSGSESKECIIEQSAIQGLSAYEVAEWLGMGWNPGNQMDAYKNGVADEICDGGVYLTQLLFDKVKAAGFTSVRLPVTWFGHIGDAPDYKIDDRLERVAEIVGYAEKAGLNIIINIHHDGSGGYGYWLDFKGAANSTTKNAEVVDQFTKVWTQIAERFVDTGDFLIFESMNEIHDGDWGWGANLTDNGHQYRLINEWNQAFVDAVRATGGKNKTRYLGIPGYAGGWELIDHMILPKDPTAGRLLVSVHCYEPGDFTSEYTDEDGNLSYYTEWGHTASEDKRSPNGRDEDDLNDIFRGLKEKFIDKNIPVYIGEYTCTNRTTGREEAFRRYYLEYFCKSATDNGLATFFWDNSGKGTGLGQGAIFDRTTGEFVRENKSAVVAMQRAVFDKALTYTLQSVYDKAPEKIFGK